MDRIGLKTRRTRTPPEQPWMWFANEDEKQAQKLKLVRSEPLANIELSTRTLNCLEKEGIVLIGDLADCNRDSLLEIENFGEQTLRECCKLLDQLGIPHPEWNKPFVKKRKSRRS